MCERIARASKLDWWSTLGERQASAYLIPRMANHLEPGGRAMKIVRPDPAQRESAVGELYFGAPIDYQYLATSPDSEQLDVCLVDFEPGGRNKMHAHVYDQILFVTAGRGIVADRNGEHIVGPGDTVIIPAGEPHWHGATATDRFSHLCIERHNNVITIVDEK